MTKEGEYNNIPTQTVALDALGLIQEELSGHLLEITVLVLDLMKILSVKGCLRTNETRGLLSPFILTPFIIVKVNKSQA